MADTEPVSRAVWAPDWARGISDLGIVANLLALLAGGAVIWLALTGGLPLPGVRGVLLGTVIVVGSAMIAGALVLHQIWGSRTAFAVGLIGWAVFWWQIGSAVFSGLNQVLA